MLNEAGSPSPAARREPPFPQSEMLRGHASAEIKIRCRMRGNLVRRDPVSGNSWRRCTAWCKTRLDLYKSVVLYGVHTFLRAPARCECVRRRVRRDEPGGAAAAGGARRRRRGNGSLSRRRRSGRRRHRRHHFRAGVATSAWRSFNVDCLLSGCRRNGTRGGILI